MSDGRLLQGRSSSRCPGGQCSEKEIRRGCKKTVARCRAKCRTPCLRSCEGQFKDCVAAADPACTEDLPPLTCGDVVKDRIAESAAFCRRQACCPIPTRVHIATTSCPEQPCSCQGFVVGRAWTYGATGTASGPVGTRLLLNGLINVLTCGGWRPEDIPFQGPSCVRTAADQPVEIMWTATGPYDQGPGYYCLPTAFGTTISAQAHSGGPDGIATADMLVVCP
jgi:hypothetical protein